jgi:hypothetical protein
MSWVDASVWFVVGAVSYRGLAVALAQARSQGAPPPEWVRDPDCWQANARQRIARPRR